MSDRAVPTFLTSVERSTDWQIAIVLFLLAWLTYANFFTSPYNANAVSRLALSLNLVRSGELTIDQFAPVHHR